MQFIDYLVQPYQSYTALQIFFEALAATTGILSVLLAIRKNIWVYPIGIISTALYTVLLYQWGLLGDMFINAYYSVMSIYGWYQWSKGLMDSKNNTTKAQWIYFLNTKMGMVLIFTAGFLFVVLVYLFKFSSFAAIPTINYIDSFITASFLLAMYLMANKKIENWYFWMIGNVFAIPVFIYKGYGITAIQYFVFLIMSFIGLYEWKKKSNVNEN